MPENVHEVKAGIYRVTYLGLFFILNLIQYVKTGLTGEITSIYILKYSSSFYLSRNSCKFTILHVKVRF